MNFSIQMLSPWRCGISREWPTLPAYFNYSDYVRIAVYTTHTVEAVHRKFLKLTTHIPGRLD